MHTERRLHARWARFAALALSVCAALFCASSAQAQFSRKLDAREPAARPPSHHDLHFAPPLDGPRFDVQSIDAQTLVVSRARSEGAGLEGFLIDVPKLIASLEQRVLKERGLDGIARLSVRRPVDRYRSDSVDASGDTKEFRYPYRFSAPFSAVEAELELAALDDRREAYFLQLLAAVFAACVLAAVYALYRMVALQVRFSERRANFVSAVSHELKTPLTAIRMYGELLRDGLVGDDQTRNEYYSLITSESERLSRLVDNVLRLGRIEHRTAPSELPPARALPSLAATLELLRPRASALGFTIQFEVEPGLPHVRYDADGLAQVLFNAVDNALKYARDATDKRIEVRCTGHSDAVLLSIRDYGPGVADAELARLGEPFYRIGSELTRGQQGVGLGLSLVKRIVEDMGGRLTVRNASPGFELLVYLRGH